MTTAELPSLFTGDVTIILMVVSFVTAIISAIVGTVGGMIVVVVGAWFIPFELWLPIHACIQAISNSSRLYMGRQHIDKNVCFNFAGGSLFGTLLGTSVVAFANRALLLVIANTFILISTWVKMVAFNFRFGIPMLGFLHGFLGGIIGASGPLGMPTLLHRYANDSADDAYNKTVINHAFFAMSSHILRIFAFGLWGYNYLDVWQFIVVFAMMAMGGTYVGTRMRDSITNKARLTLILKGILTLLVLSTLYKHLPTVIAEFM